MTQLIVAVSLCLVCMTRTNGRWDNPPRRHTRGNTWVSSHPHTKDLVTAISEVVTVSLGMDGGDADTSSNNNNNNNAGDAATESAERRVKQKKIKKRPSSRRRRSSVRDAQNQKVR